MLTVKGRIHTCWSHLFIVRIESAKSTEQDMIVSMVHEKSEKGIKVSTIISDDDTTTMSRLRQNMSPKIEKISDRNHIKKNFTSSLYSLQKKHKSLTSRVIHYLVKCFNYLLAQIQGNPQGIAEGLDALCSRPHVDHSSCSDTWCKHVNDPTHTFSSLPYRKPLQDKHLQISLKSVCNHWKQNTAKLSRLGSTQANESFNKTVSMKAPKTIISMDLQILIIELLRVWPKKILDSHTLFR